MRREKNKYIFAPQRKYRDRTHRFRNVLLILLPLLFLFYICSNHIIVLIRLGSTKRPDLSIWPSCSPGRARTYNPSVNSRMLCH